MKFAFLTIFLLMSFAVAATAQTYYGSDDIKRFREGRDKDFRNPELTPLRNDDFANFKSLQYFDVDEKYAVKATLEKAEGNQIFMIPASVGAPRRYFKYGVLKFELDGKSYQLTVFQPETAKKEEYRNLLFIPFRDLTNGKETYGAGRYLSIRVPSGSEVILNFNLAYNPSCAYGRDDLSCPLPPKENFLQTEIKAGEKVFPVSAKKQ